MKKIDKITKTVAEATRKHEAALVKAKAELDAAGERLQAAVAARDKAVLDDDVAAFTAAKDLICTIDDEIDLANRRIEMLKEAGPMPKNQINEILRDFKDMIVSLDAEAAAQICSHLDAINEIADQAEKDAKSVLKQYNDLCIALGVGVPDNMKLNPLLGTATEVGRFVLGNVCIKRFRIGSRITALAARKGSVS